MKTAEMDIQIEDLVMELKSKQRLKVVDITEDGSNVATIFEASSILRYVAIVLHIKNARI